MSDTREPIVRILLQSGVLHSKQVDEVNKRVDGGRDIISAACDAGADPTAIARALSEKFRLPIVDFARGHAEHVELLGLEYVHRFRVMPLISNSDVGILAMTNPANWSPVEDFQFALGKRVEARVIANHDLQALLEQFPLPTDELDGEMDPIARLAFLACIETVQAGTTTSLVAGIRHPSDPPAVLGESLPPKVARALISQFRAMTETTREPVGHFTLQMGGDQAALMRIAFDRNDSVVTISVVERHGF